MLLLLVTLNLFELKQPLFASETAAVGCLPLQGNDGEDLIDGGEREIRKAMEERERDCENGSGMAEEKLN